MQSLCPKSLWQILLTSLFGWNTARMSTWDSWRNSKIDTICSRKKLTTKTLLSCCRRIAREESQSCTTWLRTKILVLRAHSGQSKLILKNNKAWRAYFSPSKLQTLTLSTSEIVKKCWKKEWHRPQSSLSNHHLTLPRFLIRDKTRFSVTSHQHTYHLRTKDGTRFFRTWSLAASRIMRIWRCLLQWVMSKRINSGISLK